MKNQIIQTLKFITILSLFFNLFGMEEESINSNGKRRRNQNDNNLQVSANKKPKIEIQQQKLQVSEPIAMEIEPVNANLYRLNIQNLSELPWEIKVQIIEHLVNKSSSIEEVLKNLYNISRVNAEFFALVKYIIEEDYYLLKLINEKFSIFPILASPKLFKLFESNLLKLFSDSEIAIHLFTSKNKQNAINYLNNRVDLKRLQWLHTACLPEHCEEQDRLKVDKLINLFENCCEHVLILTVDSKLQRKDKVSLAKNFQSFALNFCPFYLFYMHDGSLVRPHPNSSKFSKTNFLQIIIKLFADDNEKIFSCFETEKSMKNLLLTIFCENDISAFSMPRSYSSVEDDHNSRMCIFESILKTCLSLCRKNPEDIKFLSGIIKPENEKIETLLKGIPFYRCAHYDPIVSKFILDYYHSEDVKLHPHLKNELLSAAVRSNKTEIVKILIERNVSLNNLNNVIADFLENSSDIDERMIQNLLTNGLNVNVKDINGKTALMGAVLNSSVSLVKLLLINGANVNTKDDNGWTPLMYAISSKKAYRLPIIKLLFEHGAARTMNDQDKQ